jgi:hypothetical protein
LVPPCWARVFCSRDCKRCGGFITAAHQGSIQDATGAATYAIIGDTAANVPAMYNVVDDYSWISVISVFGGETFFEENVAIAGMVHDQVYN